MLRSIFVFLWVASRVANASEVPEPVISIKLAGSDIEASSSVTLPVRPCEVYSMLTDYDSLPRFIPGLLQSNYERTSANTVKVLQIGEIQVFIFHVRMESLLEMEEKPNQRITFRQIKGDFVSYGGEWDFSRTAEGTLLRYNATLTFEPYIPLILAKSILKNDLEHKFAAIAREAIARNNKGMFHCSEEIQ